MIKNDLIMRLAIITTHPIQYYAPVFRLLHHRKKLEVRVFYTWGEGALEKYDPGFKKNIAWDIPLLEGYPYEWVTNTARDPGSHHMKGIVNPDILQRIEIFKPDALLVFGWSYLGHLKVMRYFKKRTLVCFRGDSTLLDENSWWYSLLRNFFLKQIYKNIDHAFYVGSNNKAYFEKYGIRGRQLSFAPHAIDNERFARDRSAEAEVLRRELKVDKNNILILFSGKLEEKKSPLLLLETFKKAAPANAHLLFVGDGPLAGQLKRQSAKNANIHFLGFRNQTEMPAIYQACDLFCLPSQGPNETWGLAVNEAMACGKAILVSDKVGSAIDLVDSNGSIFKNEEDFARNLSRLCKNKNILFKMGMRSAEIIGNYTFLAIAESIEKKLTAYHNQNLTKLPPPH